MIRLCHNFLHSKLNGCRTRQFKRLSRHFVFDPANDGRDDRTGDTPHCLTCDRTDVYIVACTGHHGNERSKELNAPPQREVWRATNLVISLLGLPSANHRGNVHDPKDFDIFRPLTTRVPDDYAEAFRHVPSIRARVH